MKQYYARKEHPARRAALLLLCVLVVAALLFLSYISVHFHDHDGPDGCCAVCTHIVVGLQKEFGFDAPFAALYVILFCLCIFLKPAQPRVKRFTPVYLKVRLNN
jgi:hypothetical protein